MHELSITQEIARQIIAASKANEIRPDHVYLDVGVASTYKEEPISYYFEIIRKDHPELTGTTLHIAEVEGMDCVIRSIKED